MCDPGVNSRFGKMETPPEANNDERYNPGADNSHWALFHTFQSHPLGAAACRATAPGVENAPGTAMYVPQNEPSPGTELPASGPLGIRRSPDVLMPIVW